ncbi:MAG TPA: hypothetical protein VN227_05760 [Methanoregula sp.]|nr:hypothetical protein [Methanoregula sp.]
MEYTGPVQVRIGSARTPWRSSAVLTEGSGSGSSQQIGKTGLEEDFRRRGISLHTWSLVPFCIIASFSLYNGSLRRDTME